MTHGEIWLIDFGEPLGIKDLNTAAVIPFTSNLERADYEPNVLY